jgi:predicted acetyltransferase
MDIQIVPVSFHEKDILRNLLEKYEYEFSQYDKRDVGPSGLYGYSYLDNYWTEKNRFPFFIKVDGNLAGFMMINDYQEIKKDTDYSMAEFFVMYKYRKMGVGKYAADYAFNKFKGRWQLMRHPKNITSVYFWNSVISGYTKGNFELIEACPEAIYDDGTCGDVFIFNT